MIFDQKYSEFPPKILNKVFDYTLIEYKESKVRYLGNSYKSFYFDLKIPLVSNFSYKIKIIKTTYKRISVGVFDINKELAKHSIIS